MTQASAVGVALWALALTACGATVAPRIGADASQSADSEASESGGDDTMTSGEDGAGRDGHWEDATLDADALEALDHRELADAQDGAVRTDAAETAVGVDACAPAMDGLPCTPPTFMPNGGNIGSGSTVRIVPPPELASPCGTIFYTTDGTLPTHFSPIYMGPIPIIGSETIRAIAYEGGVCFDSAVASATFTVTVADGGSD